MFFISMLTNLASALVTSSLLLLSYIVNTNGWLDVVPISNEVIEKLLLMNLIDGQNECKLSLAALLQVYFFKYPTFEIHIFHCIAPKFEFAAVLQTLSQHVYLS